MAFSPRLNSDGMQGSKWWYSSGNPFYTAGYGLPNCTCYAYGRYAEIAHAFAALPTGDAGKWYDAATMFEKGDTPALGAVACYASKSGKYAGHVAIVEVINSDGSIITSNSAYKGTYFWTETLTPAKNYVANWMVTNRDYYLQGFIYNEAAGPAPGPGPGPSPGDNIPLPDAAWQAKEKGAYGRESDEAFQNAIMTFQTLFELGWTVNAIAAIYGNFESESGYNPWRWESDDILSFAEDSQLIATSRQHGYGLPQFTPAGKYLYSDDAILAGFYAPHTKDNEGSPDDGTNQLIFINDYADYYPTSEYPMSYSEFKESTEDAGYLAVVWLYNYERPAHPGATEDARREAGEYWYNILSKYDPNAKRRRKGFPWWMCLKKYNFN